MLGLIKINCRDLDDRKTLRTLYCALVRCNIEYCSLIWSPYTKNGIEKLEKVQKRATKFILKTEDCYADRLKKLNLLSMEKRRPLADVTFLFKALHGIIEIDVGPYVDYRQPRSEGWKSYGNEAEGLLKLFHRALYCAHGGDFV